MQTPKIEDIVIFGDNLRATEIFKFLKKKDFSVTQVTSQSNLMESSKKRGCKEIALKSFDLAILAGWSEKIKSDKLNLPKYGFLTCHAGKLPQYRGSSPLNWAIINGEQTFGITVIKTDKEFDTGAIYASREFDLLSHYRIKDLHKIANEEFPFMVLETILKIQESIPPSPQTNRGVMYYPRRNKADSVINFQEMGCTQIMALFRAVVDMYPHPYFIAGNSEFSVLSVIEVDHSFSGTPGKVYGKDRNKLLIACRSGAVWLEIDTTQNIEKYGLIK